MSKTSIIARNAGINANTLLSDGGFVDIYTGSPPATPETAATGTKLAHVALQTPSFGAASGGSASIAGPPSAVTALATGTAGWARRYKADGTTAVADIESITATGGGGDLTLDNVSIQSGAQVQITGYTISQGA